MAVSLTVKIKSKREKFFAFLSFVPIVGLLFLNLIEIRPRVVKALKIFDYKNMIIFSPYELKIRHKIGAPVIDYYEFIKRNVPENEKILIPPQGCPWPMTGNAAYSRYFLYPRHLISGKEKEPGLDLKKENIKYVLIAWGEVGELEFGLTPGWPKFPVPAKKIIYKKEYTEIFNYEKIVVEKDFDPKDLKVGQWGLIEVDLERI